VRAGEERVQSMVMLLTPTLGPDDLALVQAVVKRRAAPTAGRQPACRSTAVPALQ